MNNNLFVSYDLDKPGQNYERVIETIKGLGNWAKVEYSLFYLDTTKSASEVVDLVWAAMDSNDKLIVIDARNNLAAWRGIDAEVATFIRDHWNR